LSSKSEALTEGDYGKDITDLLLRKRTSHVLRGC